MELVRLRLDAAGRVLSAVSVSFGVISAYITALYFFLRSAPLAMRAAAFTLSTLSLNFGVLIAASVSPLAAGARAGRRVLEQSVNEIDLDALSLAELRDVLMSDVPIGVLIAGGVGGALVLVVYVALFFMTFFMRWERRDATAG